MHFVCVCMIAAPRDDSIFCGAGKNYPYLFIYLVTHLFTEFWVSRLTKAIYNGLMLQLDLLKLLEYLLLIILQRVYVLL